LGKETAARSGVPLLFSAEFYETDVHRRFLAIGHAAERNPLRVPARSSFSAFSP
jgi:hypothetical protein